MTTVIPIKPAGKVKITPENKCSFCKGPSTCCTYFTQQIDTPKVMEDFDLLLWQISHFNTQFYKDSDGWFILVNNKCQHLQPGGLCGIYDTRPQVCRDHSNDDCEFEGAAGADDFDMYFPDYESLLIYCRKRFKKWDQRFKPVKTKAKTKRAR
ncbi:MAG: YkgJ family cysteine cluster protein [Gammaproteobacteria bacterium]|nr:YkgJ family cysteine cluster protein [Gammaproteobacteria bacterium]